MVKLLPAIGFLIISNSTILEARVCIKDDNGAIISCTGGSSGPDLETRKNREYRAGQQRIATRLSQIYVNGKPFFGEGALQALFNATADQSTWYDRQRDICTLNRAACNDFAEFVFVFKNVWRQNCSWTYEKCMNRINELEAAMDSSIRAIKKSAQQASNSTGSSGAGTGAGGTTGSRIDGGLIDDKADDESEKEEA